MRNPGLRRRRRAPGTAAFGALGRDRLAPNPNAGEGRAAKKQIQVSLWDVLEPDGSRYPLLEQFVSGGHRALEAADSEVSERVQNALYPGPGVARPATEPGLHQPR
jgi:hypothetical protein